MSKIEEQRFPKIRPITDIIECEDGVRIFMDMPGVSKEDLVIDLQDGELKVFGKTSYTKRSGEKLGHVEFGNGEYYRSFTLSNQVDKERISATLINGVLEIYLPKAAKTIPKRISITTG